jgi:phosphoglucosamine mutase
VIFLDYIPTGDGLLTALQLLQAVKESGKPLSELAENVVKYPQVLVNVRVAEKQGWDENPRIKQAIAEGEQALGDHGRILVRPSGTEPIIRVMAEGPDENEINAIVNKIAQVIESECN